MYSSAPQPTSKPNMPPLTAHLGPVHSSQYYLRLCNCSHRSIVPSSPTHYTMHPSQMETSECLRWKYIHILVAVTSKGDLLGSLFTKISVNASLHQFFSSIIPNQISIKSSPKITPPNKVSTGEEKWGAKFSNMGYRNRSGVVCVLFVLFLALISAQSCASVSRRHSWRPFSRQRES